jgi:hypothetical protein
MIYIMLISLNILYIFDFIDFLASSWAIQTTAYPKSSYPAGTSPVEGEARKNHTVWIFFSACSTEH